MKICTWGSWPQSGSRNAWTRIKNVNGASRPIKFWNFFCAIQIIFCGARLVSIEETWLYHYDPEIKKQSTVWRHSGSPLPQKIPNAKLRWKCSRLTFLGSSRHPLHWLSSKGPNYQRGVLLNSAGAIEGHFEGKTPRGGKFTNVVLFLHDNSHAHRTLATQKKVAYLGFPCLDHLPYSPDLAP